MVASPDRGATDHITFVVAVLILELRRIMRTNDAAKEPHESQNNVVKPLRLNG